MSLLALCALLLGLAALVAAGFATTRGSQQAEPDFSAYPWIYQRAGWQAGDDHAGVSVVVVGDVMLGRGLAGQGAALADVAPWLRQADLALGNLEAVLAPAGAPPRQSADGQRIILEAPPQAASWLRDAGFDVLGLANNHSLDFGAPGLAATAERLQAVGIATVGAGQGEAAEAAVIREVRGVRLALLAFNAVPDPDPAATGDGWQAAPWDEARAVALVQAAQQQAGAVIVALHWGVEYAAQPAPWQRQAAATLAAAGADLIVGHHPHVAQTWQIFAEDQALAAYSLGNLLFDHSGPESSQGLALHAVFDGEGLLGVQALTLRAGPRPRLLTAEEGESLLARLAPPAPRQAFRCMADTCSAYDEPPAESLQEGIFWSGHIDLTGDGQMEVVRRAGDALMVYEQGAEVWRSPEEWRVVDVALGDPNDDGRGEMLVALWQTDSEGHARSQPFIVGYRGGVYDVIWGGRPVTAPIQEVALGDVTGDGRQELVILEQVGEETRLAVWRWQGWNFSLHWQSDPGPYTDLRLAVSEDGLLITVAGR